ncbi:MAG: biopolymer transporter ExbD [Bdellovibrionaceae bacterium]|nr:biopolymer transporter ExbD [Bdellovibrio sp.]
MKASVLKKLKMHAPLRSMKRLHGDGGSGKEKSLFFSLNLTTLIDAFCILVIFLLSNMNSRVQTIQENQKVVLPVAVQTEALDQGLVVRIEQGQFYLEDKLITKPNLAQAILSAKKTTLSSLIIQADRQSDYENIALVLRAGGQAGYEKYIFAVMPGT